jgi:cell division protein FtsB
LGNDDAAEKFAREKYRMKKEGETVFIIVDSDGKMLD